MKMLRSASRLRVGVPALAMFLALLGVSGSMASAECQPIGGLEPLITPNSLLILGEIHGTSESPAFAAAVACHVVSTGRSLVFGLELTAEEAERIEPFLASEGTESDRKALLAGGRWRSAYQDGRSSQAMADLLEKLRSLRAEGGAVEVILFDRQPDEGGVVPAEGETAADDEPFDRDREMAQALAEGLSASEADVAVVLTGNIHSRVTVGVPWDAQLEPMTYHLLRDENGLAPGDRMRTLISLDVGSRGGEAWMCRGPSPSSCGVRRFGGRSDRASWEVERYEAVDSGHHGKYHIGVSSASPPAVRGSAVRVPGPRPGSGIR